MAGGDKRHGKEQTATAEVDKFPEGLRVLAVDDDPTCLRILEHLLRMCKYQPTMVLDAAEALKILRDGGEEKFDLVITDVHMPGIDGFQLLEQIGLHMDLPVIMLSADGENTTVYKGIAHGACDYLVKPVTMKELKNIWQHVLRKNLGSMNNNKNNNSSSDSDDVDHMVVQRGTVERDRGSEKGKKCSKKQKNDGDSSDENKERLRTTRKKPRVSWTGELHRRFLEVVNLLGGADKAYPKTILKMMNVENLTRSSIASHLQKYRIYLRRFNDDPNFLRQSPEKWNSPSSMCMNHQRGSNDMLAPSPVLGPCGVPDARRHHTKLGAFSSGHSDKGCENCLREKPLNTCNVVPSSHPAGNSFANSQNSGILKPVSQLPVQPLDPMNAPSVVGARPDAQFPYHVGNSSNPWQNVASSSFPVPMDRAPLISSHVNIPQMNQLPSFGASTGHMPISQNEQQNQMEGIINDNTTPVVNFTEEMMALFNISSKAAPVEMTSDNFSPMTQMLNGRDASGTLPMQERPDDQQAPVDDQPMYSNSFFLDELLASMPNQDVNGEVNFGGEC